MGEGALVDILDAEYTMPGELVMSVRRVRDGARVEAWPEQAQREIDALAATVAGLVRRLERLEHAQFGAVERRVVLLRWRDGVLVRQRAAAMHIKPDSPALAVGLLRARSAVWVDEEAAEGVVREVLGE